MIKIDSKVQKLRTTLSTIHQELPDRCIANDEQLLDAYSQAVIRVVEKILLVLFINQN